MRSRAEAYILLTYSTNGLTPALKAALHRTLYGYQVTKSVKGKECRSTRSGLGSGDKRIAPEFVCVPARMSEALPERLRSRKISDTVSKVWDQGKLRLLKSVWASA